jgi:hypothetical protein
VKGEAVYRRRANRQRGNARSRERRCAFDTLAAP